MTLTALGWMATAAYTLHIAEEYALGWRDWVRSITGRFVSNRFFFGFNGLVVVLGAVGAMTAGSWPCTALLFAAIMLVNATFFHIGSMIWKRGRFSPGLFTAVVLFFPIGLWTMKAGLSTSVLTPIRLVGVLCAGLLLHGIPIWILLAREGTMATPAGRSRSRVRSS